MSNLTPNELPCGIVESYTRVKDHLPADVQQCINRHWIELNRAERLADHVLRIVIDGNRTRLKEALATCLPEAYALVFSPEVLEWDKNALDTLLAHELAHVYHIATKTMKSEEEEGERQVSDTMKEWGYDDEWIDIYRIKTKIYPDAPPEYLVEIREKLRSMRKHQNHGR